MCFVCIPYCPCVRQRCWCVYTNVAMCEYRISVAKSVSVCAARYITLHEFMHTLCFIYLQYIRRAAYLTPLHCASPAVSGKQIGEFTLGEVINTSLLYQPYVGSMI